MTPTKVGCVLLLACFLAGARERLQPFPLHFVRSDGMGGAYTAVSGDPASLFYNPAHATFHRDFAMSLMEVNFRVDHNYLALVDFIRANHPYFNPESPGGMTEKALFLQAADRFDNQGFAFDTPLSTGMVYRGYGILYRVSPTSEMELDKNVLFPFVRARYGYNQELSFVHGHALTDKLSLGVALKHIVQVQKDTVLTALELENLSTWSWTIPRSSWKDASAMDLGLVRTWPSHLQLAIAVRDLFVDYEDRRYADLYLGLSKRWRNQLFAADYVDLLNDSPVLSKIKLGYEMVYKPPWAPWLLGALRAGLNGGYMSFGMGFKITRYVVLEYATTAEERGTYVGQETQRQHNFSFRIGIGI